MVDPSDSAFLANQRDLSGHHHEVSWGVMPHEVPAEQPRVVLEKPLQHVLGDIGLFQHLHQRAVLSEHEDGSRGRHRQTVAALHSDGQARAMRLRSRAGVVAEPRSRRIVLAPVVAVVHRAGSESPRCQTMVVAPADRFARASPQPRGLVAVGMHDRVLRA